jgi:hypothetical protein
MNRIFAGTMGLLLAGIFVYSFCVMLIARDSATRIASGRPYCIQVATSEGYRELSSVTQLAGLRMYRGLPLHHAVLVIGDLGQPQLLHWSYRANSFAEGAYGPPPIYCRPRQDYFNALDQSAERDRRMLFIAYGRCELLIPRSYHPRLTWPNAHLLLTAKAPNFEPTDGELLQGKLATMVELHFTSGGELDLWRYRSGNTRIEPLGSVFGLTKERVWRGDKKEPYVQYYSLRRDGTVETLIFCVSEKPEYQCEHSFEAGGMLYSLHQMPENIPQWHGLQARLVGLFDSFAVGARRWPAI